jgi:hypothetical protein
LTVADRLILPIPTRKWPILTKAKEKEEHLLSLPMLTKAKEKEKHILSGASAGGTTTMTVTKPTKIMTT